MLTPKTKNKLNEIKSIKLVYCVKEESTFSKGISGEIISSKVPKSTPSVFHAKTTPQRRFHEVCT